MSPAARPVALATALAAAVLLAGLRRVRPTSAGNGRSGRRGVLPAGVGDRRVAGDGWTVDNLTQPGHRSRTTSTLDIAQTAALARGRPRRPRAGLPAGRRRDRRDQRPTPPVLDAAAVVDLLPADADATSTSTEEGTEEGHDHGDLDPHFWLDPLLVADFADAVADRARRGRPRRRARRTPTTPPTLRAELEALDAGLHRRASRPASAPPPSSATRPSPTSRATGWHFEADRRPLPRRRAHRRRPRPAAGADHRRRRHHRLLRAPRQPARWPRRSPATSGVTTAVLDPIEGLSDDTADEDYLSLMRENLDRPPAGQRLLVTPPARRTPLDAVAVDGSRSPSAAGRSCATST